MKTPDEEAVYEVPSTLRPAAPADTPALVELAIATELFLPDEAEFLRGTLDDLHAGRSGDGQWVQVWADDPAGAPVGVVYFAPNEMGERV